jgi:hypothetical protein
MKLPMLSVAAMCLPFISTSSGACQQDHPSERPHLAHTEAPRLYFSIPSTESGGRVDLAASSADLTLSPGANLTSADIESVLQLRGNVQVRLCTPSGYGCEKGSLVLRADAVDFNEKTREIDAHGDVRIIPDTISSH